MKTGMQLTFYPILPLRQDKSQEGEFVLMQYVKEGVFGECVQCVFAEMTFSVCVCACKSMFKNLNWYFYLEAACPQKKTQKKF